MLTVKELVKRLVVIDEDIQYAANHQPLLFLEASRVRVDRMRKRSAADLACQSVEGQVWLRERARANQEDGPRPTDTYINNRVRLSARVKEAKLALEEAKASEELTKLLLEAYRMRRDGLKIIHEAQLAEGRGGSVGLRREEVTRNLQAQQRKLAQRQQSLREEEDEE